MLKGGLVEQLNIVGKRSGSGFVAHKAMLVKALSRALASRVMLIDLTIGRKGLLGYLKAVGGSNVVKVIPSNGSASGSQATGKGLKVICGANTSYLADSHWIGEKTPFTLCEVRASPSNSVKPNVGAIELAEALSRVLPFTAREDDRPVLACVNFEAKDGKLTLVSADGFRLAVVSLDYYEAQPFSCLAIILDLLSLYLEYIPDWNNCQGWRDCMFPVAKCIGGWYACA